MPVVDPLTAALRTRPIASHGLLVGFSGGLDSTVLLHALATTPGLRDAGLRAIHVHHGLHADADLWAAHCRLTCDALGVPMVLARVRVDHRAGLGLEASARAARYSAFRDALGPDETLVLAHHRDDQAETVLLRLLRASGGAGLAGMPAGRPFAHGALWRPWLDIPRASLVEAAAHHGLQWIEDPSNADESLDRNFLRARVLPLLTERWPQAGRALSRSAALLAEDAALLAAEAAVRLAQVQGVDPQTLSVTALMRLPPAWRARVLRAWVIGLGLPPLPGNAIPVLEADLLVARPDAEPRLCWRGAIVRRWRDLLHAEGIREALPTDWEAPWDGQKPLLLPTGDRLAFVGAGMNATGRAAEPVVAVMPAPTGDQCLVALVRARRGGERLTQPGRAHSHSLKHVLQDLGVPPWERERLPLVFAANGELLAVGDLAISARLAAWSLNSGRQLRWIKL
jgi:tRNA(Ile)-lysidine synthase